MAQVLPTVVGQMVAARGRDETTAWRQPVDLVALLERACVELPALFAAGRGKGPWRDHAALAQAVLGDDPAAIVAALRTQFATAPRRMISAARSLMPRRCA